MPLPEPRALDPDRDALFLDFDGTLVEIAPTPEAVRPAPGLAALLDALDRRAGGAVALVTGRPIADVDRFLNRPALAVAGLHGRDRRLRDGGRLQAEPEPGLVELARARLTAAAARLPGTLIEDKGESVALHYRQAPEAAEAAHEEARAVVAASGGRLRLVPGKMVVELMPAGFDKGTAIGLLLETPPFRGRTPVFAGDDVTDEAGFEVVNRLGGLSVRVGAAGVATAACSLLSDVVALHGWLRRAVEGQGARG